MLRCVLRVHVMKWGRCLSLSLVLAAQAIPVRAQATASSDDFSTWALLSTPSALGPAKPGISKPGRAKPISSETTQSIPRQTVAEPAAQWEAGWNLTTDETSASLIYAMPEKSSAAKPAPVGFSCHKGDGFVTFRSPPGSHAAGKRLLVQLRSRNGSIRIDAHAGPGNVIESESPVRTSSLVFVLTPKIEPHRKKKDAASQGAKLTVGGWSAAIPEGTSDVKLLRFQTLCDQPVASAE